MVLLSSSFQVNDQKQSKMLQKIEDQNRKNARRLSIVSEIPIIPRLGLCSEFGVCINHQVAAQYYYLPLICQAGHLGGRCN